MKYKIKFIHVFLIGVGLLLYSIPIFSQSISDTCYCCFKVSVSEFSKFKDSLVQAAIAKSDSVVIFGTNSFSGPEFLIVKYIGQQKHCQFLKVEKNLILTIKSKKIERLLKNIKSNYSVFKDQEQFEGLGAYHDFMFTIDIVNKSLHQNLLFCAAKINMETPLGKILLDYLSLADKR